MEVRSNEKWFERRHLTECELRASDKEDNKPNKLAGYAALFNSYSEDLGGFREIIKPGAFNRNFPDTDVRALRDHEPSRVLGRTKSGTLILSVNSKGLVSDISAPDTTDGRDVMELVRRGDVDGMSFGFRVITDNWRMQNDEVIRELLDVELFDVSVVTYPAYRQTTVAVRSFDVEIAKQSTLLPALRKIEHDLELTEADRTLVTEHRSLLQAKLPAELREKLFNPEVRSVPPSILKLKLQLAELA
ncbi:MAG: HK97 family phage prohead protease [Candidatus Obscuribacterales bacterium]|nr:HK97 family phage prohead protease [Candidatus Obscuribacterales bacterium]